MKRIPESKVARWPRSITKLALIYACCFVLCAMLSFSVCYAYFSAKVEATGTIAVGKLEIQYVDSAGETLTTLNSMIIRDGEEYEDDINIIPGDTIKVTGNIKNTGSIDAYVVLQAEFILMSEDTTTEEKIFDSKFYDLSGNLITYDTTNKIYSTPATALVVDDSEDLENTDIAYVVNTGLTSEYSGRTFKLRLTTHAIQSENLEEDVKYSSIAIQATNMMLTSTPHLVTDAKIYGNSVQKVGSGKNLVQNVDEGLNTPLVKNNDGTYTITKTSAGRISGDIKANLQMGVQYTISCEIIESTAKNYSLCIYSTESNNAIYFHNFPAVTTPGKLTKTFTIGTDKRDVKYIRVYLSGDEADGSYTTFKNLQIEQGATATEYEPYAGKNIYNHSSDTRFTKQEDGSYLSNTTISTRSILTDLKGVYTISVKVKCPVGKNYRIRAYYADGTYTDSYKASTGDYIDISLTTNGKDIDYITWYFSEGSNQVQFKDFQIEYGTVATAYEPYIGSPSPEAPAEIESVGERTKNLFNVQDVKWSYGDLSVLIEDNVVILTSTGTKGAQFAQNYVKNLDATESYTLSFKAKKVLRGETGTSNIKINIYGSNDDATYTSVTVPSKTPSQGTEYSISATVTGYKHYRFYIYNNSGSPVTVGEQTIYYDIQFEKGTTATEYEPFGYKLDITRRGKNLFNYIKAEPLQGVIVEELENGAILNGNDGTTEYAWSSGWYTPGQSTASANGVNLKGGDVVTVSADATLLEIGNSSFSNNTKIYLRTKIDSTNVDLYGTNILLNLNEKQKISYTFTINDGKDGRYYPIFVINSHTIKIENIQIEYGNTATEYEPYIGNETHTIYLDEPLRKVGDVADYVEIKDGVAKVVRNVYSFTLNNSTSIFKYASFTSDDGTIAIKFAVGGEDGTMTKANQYNKNIICSHFASLNFGQLYNNKMAGVAVHSSLDGHLYMYNGEFTTLEEYLQYFDDCASSGNAIEIAYVLATPTEETIQLDDMFTLAGDTIYEFGGEIAPSDYYFS